jgi:hypothetical protein
MNVSVSPIDIKDIEVFEREVVEPLPEPFVDCAGKNILVSRRII